MSRRIAMKLSRCASHQLSAISQNKKLKADGSSRRGSIFLLTAVNGGGGFVDGPGAQPHRDVGGLHRLLHHPQQLVVQSLEVRLIAEPGGEGLQRLPHVVLSPVEAPVHRSRACFSKPSATTSLYPRTFAGVVNRS